MFILDSVGTLIDYTEISGFRTFPYYGILNKDSNVEFWYSGDDAMIYECSMCGMGSYFLDKITYATDNNDTSQKAFLTDCNNFALSSNSDNQEVCDAFHHDCYAGWFFLKPYLFDDSVTLLVYKKFILQVIDSSLTNNVTRSAMNREIIDVVKIDSARYLIFTKESIEIAQLNDSIAILVTNISSMPIAVTELTHGKVFFVDSTLSVHAINDSLTLISFGSLSGYMDTLISIKPFLNSIGFLGKTSSQEYVYLNFDTNYNLLTNTILSNPGFEAKHFEISGNQIVLLGNEITYANQHPVSKSYVIAGGLSENNSTDAGIINVEIETVKSERIFEDWSVRIENIINIYYSIINFGNDTIDNVAVNFLITSGRTCGTKVSQYLIFNQSIAPGETINGLHITVSFTAADYQFSYVPPTTFDVCVWTSAPNFKIDRNHENDFSCKNILLTSAIDRTNESGIRLYPNPADNLLYLQLADLPIGTETEITFSDLLGKRLMTLKSKDNITAIDIQELKNGIYIVSVHYNDIITQHKIVIQR